MERNLTLAQLAEMSGLSASYLSTIERGLKKPAIPVLTQISEALNVSSALLVEPEENKFTGEKLKLLRLGRELSIEELAELSEVSAEAIKKIEADELQPEYEQLEQIANALNLAITYFTEKSHYKNDIGAKLKRLRENKGLTITALADKSGISNGLVSQIENSYCIPSLDTLEKIAEATGTTLHYFLLDDQKVDSLLTSLGPDLIELLSDHKVQLVLRSIRDFSSNELLYVLNYLSFFKRNRKILS